MRTLHTLCCLAPPRSSLPDTYRHYRLHSNTLFLLDIHGIRPMNRTTFLYSTMRTVFKEMKTIILKKNPHNQPASFSNPGLISGDYILTILTFSNLDFLKLHHLYGLFDSSLLSRIFFILDPSYP